MGIVKESGGLGDKVLMYGSGQAGTTEVDLTKPRWLFGCDRYLAVQPFEEHSFLVRSDEGQSLSEVNKRDRKRCNSSILCIDSSSSVSLLPCVARTAYSIRLTLEFLTQFGQYETLPRPARSIKQLPSFFEIIISSVAASACPMDA